MAKQHKRSAPKGKPQASKPITSHQLFPAVVALWFGALFGLGSLAVRPSLIESLVMKSRIDLIVPAAAPPLGITARMLIALVLAAIGAVLGVMIARRSARPKVEQRQRKRGVRSGDAAASGYASRSGHAAPLSVHDEIGPDAESGGVLAGRRRGALAIEQEEPEFVPHEMAPLPGGAPQVLDIAGIELAEYAPIESAEAAHAPLDLGAYAEPAPAPAAPFGQPIHAQADARQLFQPLPEADAPVTEAPFAPKPAVPPFAMPAPAAPAPAMPSFAAPAEPVPAFAAPVAAAPPPVAAAPEFQPAEPASARQIFGMPIDGDHIDPEFVRAAGFKTSVFETEAAEPLFNGRMTSDADAELPPAMPAAQVHQSFAPPAAPEPVAAAPALVEPAPAPVIAPADPLPSVTGLGMTDLATRLQQSMQRRRAARSGEAGSAEQATVPVVAEAEPVVAAPPAFAAPQAFAAPPEPVLAPFAAPAPVAAAPIADAISLLNPAPVHAAPDPAAVITPAPLPMPASLRPLNLEAMSDDDDDMLASLLPPRHIAMPVTAPASAEAPPAPFAAAAPEAPSALLPAQPAPFTAPASFAAPAAPFASPVAEEEPAAVEVEVAEEESYASLLDIGQPLSARSQFVRIEEPEAESQAVEPVVIFPGQAPLAPPAPFAASLAEADTVPFRRFDAPSAAGQGGPIAGQAMQSSTDPAEADQALRAALANLQRMSGAA
ncbi:hypothetical protein [Novosphingobium sp. B 225]|uniref:hypothetical protein n=1 Tax=Novosphingobium sp. B 225 TaxID=1961849 RepID=UPI000B4BE189|nr:hypothetical protein [Novosphingobium sp. B 225]